MSKIKRYIAFCEENGYTNEEGEVVSMEYAEEYMKTQQYAEEHAVAFYEKDIASNCCARSILVNTDSCSECGEHCAPVLLSDLEYEDLIENSQHK